MIKFTTTLIATALLLATSQVSAKVSVEAEKATQVNTQELVTSATDYLNSALNQPAFMVESPALLTAKNTLAKPMQSEANSNVELTASIEAE